MSGTTQLEDEVRRSLRSAADALVVEDLAFDPARPLEVELDEWSTRTPRRVERTALVAAAVVVVLVAAAAVVHETGGSHGGSRVGDTPTTPQTALPTAPTTEPTPTSAIDPATLVASVPASVLADVGAGSSSARPVAGSGPMLTEDGKPRVVWIGTEYCPYSAAQRWPLIVALSRFGTFSNLGLTSSATNDVDPDTQTFSFHGSSYASPYVAFDAVETASNVPSPDGSYVPLDALTPEEKTLQDTFDAPPYASSIESAGAIPFVDFANQYIASGATYDLSVLQGETRDEIANALSDPTSGIAKGVDGSANVITASICALTANQPASACSDPVTTALEAQLPRRS